MRGGDTGRAVERAGQPLGVGAEDQPAGAVTDERQPRLRWDQVAHFIGEELAAAGDAARRGVAEDHERAREQFAPLAEGVQELVPRIQPAVQPVDEDDRAVPRLQVANDETP